MISLAVQVDDKELKKLVRKLPPAMRGTAANEVISEAAAEVTREHLRSLHNTRHRPGLSKSFYLSAADAVVSLSDDNSAVVDIPHTGLALRYYGGDVYPSGKISLITGKPIRHLAIPVEGSEAEGKTPYDLRGSTSLVVTKRKKAFLVKKDSDEEITPLFWLVEKSHHEADKTVLPTDEALQKAASEALNEMIMEVANGR